MKMDIPGKRRRMDQRTIRSALTKIELIWSTTSKEKSDDPRSYEYIAAQSMVLKNAVYELNMMLAAAIREDKETKMKYQKLQKSLNVIAEVLDFHPTPCKDETYIQDILDKLRKVGSQIRELADYLQ